MKLIVSKSQALELLTKHREQHIKEYEIQLDAWKKSYAEHTEALNVWAQSQSQDNADSDSSRPHPPQKPSWYVEDYDRFIKQLNYHLAEEVELDTQYGNEYQKIFENRFDWSRSFASLSSNYIKTGHIQASVINAINEG